MSDSSSGSGIGGRISDILSAMQNGVTAINNLTKRLATVSSTEAGGAITIRVTQVSS